MPDEEETILIDVLDPPEADDEPEDEDDSELDSEDNDANSEGIDSDDDTADFPIFDPTTPEGLINYDRQTVAIVSAAEWSCSVKESTLTKLNEQRKEAKAEFEAARMKLRRIIRERNDGRTKKPAAKVRTLLDLKPEGDGEASTEPEPSDLWKQYPLTFATFGRFGLTEKDCEKLNAGEVKGGAPSHPILNFGDVSRFIQPNPANPGYARTLADLKGFGEAGVKRFAEAEEKFWAWWKGGGEVEFAAEHCPDVEAVSSPAVSSSPPAEEVGQGDGSVILEKLHEAKTAYPGMIVLFENGDFYEAFEDDAKLLHEELKFVLVERDGVPMVGFPTVKLEEHLRSLLQAGHRVAVAERDDAAGTPVAPWPHTKAAEPIEPVAADPEPATPAKRKPGRPRKAAQK